MQPTGSPAPQVSLVYRIDAGDRLTYVNPAWLEFARNNEGESVMPEKVLGQSMWTCVTDATVREIYQRMIARARAGRPVHFHYRCDAPTKRRVFAMTIRPVAGGEVEFVSTLEQEETRPAVGLLESGRRRDQRLLRICSWCQKVALPANLWVPVETAVEHLQLMETETMPRITHGICDTCAARLLETR